MSNSLLMRAAIIMAGGSGERFWPLSTADRPKQLLDLTGSGKTLLEEAIERARALAGENIFVSTSRTLAAAIAESGLVPTGNILAEPEKRNTLGALVWSMGQLTQRYGSGYTAAILTADHRIEPLSEFVACAAVALDLAEGTNGLVTLGIHPTRPETGYGYIEQGEGTKVARFVEKPDLATAESYVSTGRFLWNSGMFFWTERAFAHELQLADPTAAAIYGEIAAGSHGRFAEIRSQPIDRALMERSSQVHVIPAAFEWDDLGSWDALLRANPADENGNVVIGEAELVDCHRCLVYATGSHPRIQLLGWKDAVLVHTGQNLAVFPTSRCQDVRTLANITRQSDSKGR